MALIKQTLFLILEFFNPVLFFFFGLPVIVSEQILQLAGVLFALIASLPQPLQLSVFPFALVS
jgi:hypothetical protein